MALINPTLLRHFGIKLKMSHDDLIRHSRMDNGTIHRFESARMASNTVRPIVSLAEL